jgi:hypothetical protein
MRSEQDGPRLWDRRILAVLGAALLATFASTAQADEDYVVPTDLRGMSGLVNIPSADVLPQNAIRFGFSLVDAQWAYGFRDQTDNNHYFLSVGFVPRVELSFRATYFPNNRLIAGSAEGTVDRGGSGRLLVLTEGKKRPAVAVGIHDARGTRRFHSLYIVGSKWVTLRQGVVKTRLSAGYGSTQMEGVHDATLDGLFGGAEIVFSEFVSVALDFDTEKWNTSLRLIAFRHLAAHLAFLNFEAPAGGFSWTQRF